MKFEDLINNFSLEQVENYYKNNLIDQGTWEHYCWHWKNESIRFSNNLPGFNIDKCPICNKVFDAHKE